MNEDDKNTPVQESKGGFSKFQNIRAWAIAICCILIAIFSLIYIGILCAVVCILAGLSICPKTRRIFGKYYWIVFIICIVFLCVLASQVDFDSIGEDEGAANVSDSFDEAWYKNNTYTDEDGNEMSFAWLDDGSFQIEFEWGAYSAYDLDASGYTINDEGYYIYDGDGYCIEYDAKNNAVLLVPGSGGSVWYYAD